MKNIVSIFAGREKNINVLSKYLITALELNIIQEVHFWNFTKNLRDEEYLKSISNLKRSSSSQNNYIEIFTPIIENQINLSIKASNDIHIKIVDTNKNNYEIILGGWSNTQSVIKKNDVLISCLLTENVCNHMEYFTFTVVLINGKLFVLKNDEIVIFCNVDSSFNINRVFFKTGHNSIGHINYQTRKNNGFYLMDTCNKKSWKDYYTYYNNADNQDDIIIKCDDDIVFIDLNKLPEFIEFTRVNDYDLIFANTINNGVAAYFQQNKFKLIPKELMTLEYPKEGKEGTLWESGEKAELLHNYFIDNYMKFLEYDYEDELFLIKTRFSINFFAYKGSKWGRIADCYMDDERNLTVDYVKDPELAFTNILYSDFYVAHLSFYKQIETGINIDNLIDKYDKLAKKFLMS